MKFLIDAQLPPALCGWLRDRGHEAVHVSEIGLAVSERRVIAARAEAAREILVSKDEDFVFLRLPDRFGLLWLRCGNATNAALSLWLAARWDRVVEVLKTGEHFIEVR